MLSDKRLIISRNALEISELGISDAALFPVPANFPTLGSIGSLPKNGTLDNSANDCPPPVEKMFVHSSQFGQT